MPEGGTLTLRTRPCPDRAREIRCERGSRGHRHRHGRRDPPPLPGAVLHHQGRARHRAWAWPWSTASCSGTTRRSKSTARPAQGTTVRLQFPQARLRTSGPNRPAPDTIPSRLRILVVDDDPLLIKSLRDTLETDGHVVMTANGGQEGIDAFQAADGQRRADLRRRHRSGHAVCRRAQGSERREGNVADDPRDPSYRMGSAPRGRRRHTASTWTAC